MGILCRNLSAEKREQKIRRGALANKNNRGVILKCKAIIRTATDNLLFLITIIIHFIKAYRKTYTADNRWNYNLRRKFLILFTVSVYVHNLHILIHSCQLYDYRVYYIINKLLFAVFVSNVLLCIVNTIINIKSSV